MEIETSVFSSKITRSQNKHKNNLYDLLNKSPAKPVEVSDIKDESYDFFHKTEKYYISQKKSQLKVKTVAEIRKLFEQDICSYLPNEIENQQHTLLSKIREGSTNDETTRKLAKNILNSDKPTSRSTWQMLTNINPERHTYNKQFVLWNGRCIQVNGSKGGDKRFICQYDLSDYKLHKNIVKKSKQVNKRSLLLKNSLSIKFKPGPLTKKQYLDDSYQKHHIGKVKLINIPKAGLEICPSYGVGLEPNITQFINGFRSANGVVSEKWAEFAVSTLGVLNNGNVTRVDTNSCITFDLLYKYNQERMLMRCDVDNTLMAVSEQHDSSSKKMQNIIVDKSEIEDITNKMLDSVEISLKQDTMYTNELLTSNIHEHLVNTIHYKKRKYCELDRLDVTVIRIPEDTSNEKKRVCHKEYCNLGCICASLECSQLIKNHCGLVECMFKCQCDFFKYKHMNSLPNQCSELIPGLLNLNSEMNLKLAKEEKKFHQTVLFSGEKSILLKAQKRNWKASKKYGDFYKNVNLKTPIESNQILSILTLKIDAKNIEPWCLIHKLYKCFCKGKFNSSSVAATSKNHTTDNSKIIVLNKEDYKTDIVLDDHKNSYDRVLRIRHNRINSNNELCQINDTTVQNKSFDKTEHIFNGYCARIEPYRGRKYTNNYYKTTNNKILEMEKNDKNLHKRMKAILTKADANEESDTSYKMYIKEPKPSVDIINNESVDKSNSNPLLHDVLHKTNLATWLAASYKLYKSQTEHGKLILTAPKPGKLALYPWDFLLKRYKERKNMFLVTKKKPYRIFMAINTEDEVLKECMFIDEIRFSDFHKYPLTIKNLLTNVTNLENIFYILYGFSKSWELIGSVTKLCEPQDRNIALPITYSESCSPSRPVQDFLIAKNISEIQSDEYSYINLSFSSPSPSSSTLITDTLDTNNISRVQLNQVTDKSMRTNSVSASVNNISETSKWFVMNIENDFTEIQFCNKGFFVKNDSILKAIKVAQKTGKTVRLSTQTCASKSSCPQFGIYAIPDSKGRYVFVGPYEIDEPLGIEILKKVVVPKKQKTSKKTRGIWITTDKLDNMKVIDNPLSFMPTANIDYNVMVSIDAVSTNNSRNLSKYDNKNNTKQNSPQSMKAIKPITIRKTNGFYHLAPNGTLKKVPLQSPKKVAEPLQGNSNRENLNSLLLITSESTVNNLANDSGEKNLNELNSLGSNTSQNNVEGFKRKGGMLVLKPDEINKRILDDTLNKTGSHESTIIDVDIEKFLSNETFTLPCDKEEFSTVVISDDSEDNSDEDFFCDNREWEVLIECTNIKNFGWIKGKKNVDSLLSFEFPGFKPSEFYYEEEAFNKINQILSRKIYIPKHITLAWKVIECGQKLENKNMLDVNNLNSDYVLTEDGLQSIVAVENNKYAHIKNEMKTDIENQYSPKDSKDAPSTSTCVTDEALDILQYLEDKSVHVENEGIKLMNEVLANKSEIMSSLTTLTEKVKQEMTDKLKNIEKFAED